MGLIKTKQRTFELVKRYFLLTLGCFLLAAGSVCFLEPFDLVTGGIFSIAIIVQHFVQGFSVIDIVTWSFELVMLGLAFLTLGKKYALRSLFATLVYPAFITLLTRVPMIHGMTAFDYFLGVFTNHAATDPDWGLRILAAMAGGCFIGLGVGICYNAGGSTGGLDVIASIVAKHTPIKEGTTTFIIDALLVVLGVAFLRNLPNGIIGVLSAFICALVVQYVYVSANRFVIADILSSETDKIRKYVEDVMDRTTTIVEVTGGYTGEKRKLLRVAFSKGELPAFRAYIASVDPRAFVTFTQAAMINGEGFDPLGSTPLIKSKKSDTDNEDLHG